MQYSDYLSLSILPPDLTRNGQCTFLKKVSHYVIMGGLLYKRGFNGILLQCLTISKIPYTIKEVHDGICEGHFSGLTVAKHILLRAYY